MQGKKVGMLFPVRADAFSGKPLFAQNDVTEATFLLRHVLNKAQFSAIELKAPASCLFSKEVVKVLIGKERVAHLFALRKPDMFRGALIALRRVSTVSVSVKGEHLPI